MTMAGVPLSAILGQMVLGLVNGSFYALLSLGLAVIFGLMGIVNFAHGAFYMLGAFAAYVGLQYFGINYWMALLLSPLAVGLLGVIVERLFLLWISGGEVSLAALAFHYCHESLAAAAIGGMEAVARSEHFSGCIAARPSNRERLMNTDVAQFIAVMKTWREAFLKSAKLPIVGATEAQ